MVNSCWTKWICKSDDSEGLLNLLLKVFPSLDIKFSLQKNFTFQNLDEKFPVFNDNEELHAWVDRLLIICIQLIPCKKFLTIKIPFMLKRGAFLNRYFVRLVYIFLILLLLSDSFSYLKLLNQADTFSYLKLLNQVLTNLKAKT